MTSPDQPSLPKTQLEILTWLLNNAVEEDGTDSPSAMDLRRQIAMHEKPRAENPHESWAGGTRDAAPSMSNPNDEQETDDVNPLWFAKRTRSRMLRASNAPQVQSPNLSPPPSDTPPPME